MTPGETLVFRLGGRRLVMRAAATPTDPRQFAVGVTIGETVANLAAALARMSDSPGLSAPERRVAAALGTVRALGGTLQFTDVPVYPGGRHVTVDVPHSTAVDEPAEGVVVFA